MNLKFLRFQTRPPKGASEEPEPPGRALRRLSCASPEQKATTRKQTYVPGGHSSLLKLAGREEKQTTSLIMTRKTAMLFSVFTEKRKNAGLSLKSCAEYTKINDKFNRGFTSPGRAPQTRPERFRRPRSNSKIGRAQGPALAPPFGSPKREHASFSDRGRGSLFPGGGGLFQQSAKAPPPAGLSVDSRRSPFQSGRPDGG